MHAERCKPEEQTLESIGTWSDFPHVCNIIVASIEWARVGIVGPMGKSTKACGVVRGSVLSVDVCTLVWWGGHERVPASHPIASDRIRMDTDPESTMRGGAQTRIPGKVSSASRREQWKLPHLPRLTAGANAKGRGEGPVASDFRGIPNFVLCSRGCHSSAEDAA
jgi:hypothetical protein